VTLPPEQIIADWKHAYELANGFAPTANVTHQRGWYVFSTVWLGVERRRGADVVAMTKRLHERYEDALTAIEAERGL
jgi:hypothetical protein